MVTIIFTDHGFHVIDEPKGIIYEVIPHQSITIIHPGGVKIMLTPSMISLSEYHSEEATFHDLGSLLRSEEGKESRPPLTTKDYSLTFHPRRVVYLDYDLDLQEEWTFEECELIDLTSNTHSTIYLDGRLLLNE